MTISQINREKITPWLIIAAALLYYLTFFNYGLEVDDEGYFLLGGAEVLRGKWPMADFTSYGPLSYWLLAGSFRLFGNGVMAERILLLPFLLANGLAVYWIARRILPLRWSAIVTVLYLSAPGPWYKPFFISSVLLMTVMALRYLDRPGVKRAALLGLAIGIGFLFRKEAGILGLPFMLGVFALLFLRKWLDEKRVYFPAIFHVACGVAGALVPPAITGAIYAAAGKWGALAANSRDYIFSGYTKEMLAKMGVFTPFNPLLIFQKFDVEQIFYAEGLIASAGLFLASLWVFFARPAKREAAATWIVTGAAALASMTYCFPFVWSTRMLLTFPVVYICYAAVLLFLSERLRDSKVRAFVLASGFAVAALPVLIFTQHQIYSGSITTRLLAPVVRVKHPLLRGVYPYEENRLDIERLMEEMAKAPPDATLVSMSESTTMGYLSGLSNPTVYRAFSLEFARPGAEEEAIETFERLKITYFVARRMQFFGDGGPASDLDAYAPRIKQYLLKNYNVIPLGEHFLLLKRKSLAPG